MTRKSFLVQAGGLVGWLALTFVAAAVGSVASTGAGPFYEGLSRPAWAPPAWLFGPVWGLLYLAMGTAAWLAWRANWTPATRIALALYVLQLAGNALWTWLFFAWREGALAFGEIVLLWLLIAITTVSFWRLNKPAGWLMVPYLLWVTYAAALTFSVWQRNPDVLG